MEEKEDNKSDDEDEEDEDEDDDDFDDDDDDNDKNSIKREKTWLKVCIHGTLSFPNAMPLQQSN
jgi:hypothetical protein